MIKADVGLFASSKYLYIKQEDIFSNKRYLITREIERDDYEQQVKVGQASWHETLFRREATETSLIYFKLDGTEQNSGE